MQLCSHKMEHVSDELIYVPNDWLVEIERRQHKVNSTSQMLLRSGLVIRAGVSSRNRTEGQSQKPRVRAKGEEVSRGVDWIRAGARLVTRQAQE